MQHANAAKESVPVPIGANANFIELTKNFEVLSQITESGAEKTIRHPHATYRMWGILSLSSMQYANANMKDGRMSILLPICDGLSKSLVNSMVFTFATIGTRTDSFAAFAFTFATFVPMEAQRYVYRRSVCFSIFYCICIPHTACKES